MSTRTHTHESIIAAVQAWVETHGEIPKARQWVRASYTHPSANTARTHFGGWNLMIEAAGYKPRIPGSPGRKDITHESIIAACQTWVGRYGRTPTTRQWIEPHREFPCTHTVLKRFGTWNAMLHAAGYEPRGKHSPRRWTKDRIAAAFLDFLIREGRWPTVRNCEGEFSELLPNRGTVYGVFGSFTAARIYSGASLGPRPPRLARPCAGCGGRLDNYTRGCEACGNRRRKRAKKNVPAGLVAGLIESGEDSPYGGKDSLPMEVAT